MVAVLEGGGNRVTLTPASWNSSIGAGQSIDVSFNAESVGLENSGELSNALFFLAGSSLDDEQPDDVTSLLIETPVTEDSPADDDHETPMRAMITRVLAMLVRMELLMLSSRCRRAELSTGAG